MAHQALILITGFTFGTLFPEWLLFFTKNKITIPTLHNIYSGFAFAGLFHLLFN